MHFLRVILSLSVLFLKGAVIISLFPFLPLSFVHTIILDSLLGYFILKQKTLAIIVAVPCSFFFAIISAVGLYPYPWMILSLAFYFSCLLEFILLFLLGALVLERECFRDM